MVWAGQEQPSASCCGLPGYEHAPLAIAIVARRSRAGARNFLSQKNICRGVTPRIHNVSEWFFWLRSQFCGSSVLADVRAFYGRKEVAMALGPRFSSAQLVSAARHKSAGVLCWQVEYTRQE